METRPYGFSFIDHLFWDNFNEAGDLILQIVKIGGLG